MRFRRRAEPNDQPGSHQLMRVAQDGAVSRWDVGIVEASDELGRGDEAKAEAKRADNRDEDGPDGDGIALKLKLDISNA